MAGENFTLMPTWVIPEAPKYNIIVTQTESMKKEYFQLGDTPVEAFIFKFDGLSDTNFKVLYDHYKSQSSGYALFSWINAYIPEYVKVLLGITIGDLSGRWGKDSFKFKPKPKHWTAEILFERSI